MTTVLLHGLGQTPDSWDAVARNLGGNTLQPDLFAPVRGGAGTWRELFHAFSQYCETLDGPFQLCGLSLGGILALQYTAEHPERVKSLALIGTQCVMPKRLLALQSALFRLLPDKTFQPMGLSKGDVIGLTRSMRTLDFRGQLEHISCPVLVLCGQRDRANRKAARNLCQELPQAELVWIPEAGHKVNRDAPEALAEVLRSFFQRAGKI